LGEKKRIRPKKHFSLLLSFPQGRGHSREEEIMEFTGREFEALPPGKKMELFLH